MMKKSVLILASLFLFANAEYLRNESQGVVLDTRTNLMWQDDALVGGKTWKEAIDYCENLDLAGYTDWRLPNFNEYDSLIDTERNNPALSPVFENVATDVYDKYWTSTTYMDENKTKAWTLQTRNGWNYQSEKSENDGSLFIRCVRGKN
ncbi:DUF1566 domain-containing protein [Hydrogenimonas urashimensis]|uniref:Lcl C-terminal domain-containing protein n=1 Tax=Hydrogenimonas urashimensis TaxID=2740515 RepID=UPI00191552C5|nr:DUF1566 domain-containing protein [Hydrogenimonas urashimensis]